MKGCSKLIRVAGSAAMLALTFVAPIVQAQAPQCPIPADLPTPRLETAPPGSAKILPLTGFVLAMTWSPQFCKSRTDDRRFASQCGAQPPFGFILHGLWPDAEGQSEPRWCRRAPLLSREIIRQTFCATPSPQLMQREWAKHGSCITTDPDRYFSTARSLFAAIAVPDMNSLSRQGVTVADVKSAFVARNPALRPEMIRVNLSDLGWLEEIRVCYGRDYRPRACPRDIGGAGDGSRVRIWRTER